MLEIKLDIQNKGSEKSSSVWTKLKLESIKDDFLVLLNRNAPQGGALILDENEPKIQWFDRECAFNKCVSVGQIKNLQHIDVSEFLKDAKRLASNKIKEIMVYRSIKNVKVYAVLGAMYYAIKNNEIIEELKNFNTKAFAVFATSNIDELYSKNISEPILQILEEFQEKNSGWSLKSIEFLNLVINKFNPLRVGSYIDLPAEIKIKRACLNVKNRNDEECFKWAILSTLRHFDYDKKHECINCNRVSKYKALEQIEKYKLNFNNLKFPIKPYEIPAFEKQNDVSVNLYILKQKKSKFQVFPYHLSNHIQDDKKHVDLLLIEDKYDEENDSENFENDEIQTLDEYIHITKKRKLEYIPEDHQPLYHYVWIKDFSRLAHSQLTANCSKLHICKRCMHYFYNKERLNVHLEDCQKINKCKIKLPTPHRNKYTNELYDNDDDYKTVKFRNFRYQEKVPFAIYADFESIIIKNEDKEANEILEHKPLAIGYYFKCRYDDSKSYYHKIFGENCAELFAKELKLIALKVKDIFENVIPMDLTDQQKRIQRCCLLSYLW